MLVKGPYTPVPVAGWLAGVEAGSAAVEMVMVAPGRRGAEAGHLHQSTDLQHTTSLLTAARRLTPAEIKLNN